MSAAGGSSAALEKLARSFRPHLWIFVAANAVLTGINLATGAPWWAFWPLVAWGLALLVHFLFYKAAVIDDRWVDERTEDLRTKSYDFSHIDDIRERHGADTPRARRNTGPGAGGPPPPKGR